MTTALSPAHSWHVDLVAHLPLIRSAAARSFRFLSPGEREEAVCEVVADCAVEFARLAARGRANFWFLPALARFAVRGRIGGRRVGTPAKRRDAMSPVPRPGSRVTASLDAMEAADLPAWRVAVADSRRTDPAEAAAFRVDFNRWLLSLTADRRELVALLAEGERPGDVAARLGVTPGRVSQIRGELRESWASFQGEGADED